MRIPYPQSVALDRAGNGWEMIGSAQPRRCTVRGCGNTARSSPPLHASEYCADHFMPVAVRYRCFHEGSITLAPEVATIERQMSLRRFARTYDCQECTPVTGEGLA